MNPANEAAQAVFDELCADPEVWATHGMPGTAKEQKIVAAIARALQSAPLPLQAVPPEITDALNRAEWLIDQMPPNGKHWEKRLQFGAALTAARAALQSAPLPLPRAVPPIQWQPIETAPKDGAWVFGYWPTMRATFFPVVMFWDDGWELVNDYMREYGEIYPTHWMQMPITPEKGAAPEAPLPGQSAAPIGDPHWSHCAAIGGPGFHVCRDSDTVMHYIIATGLTLEQATRLADCHNMALDQATPSPAGQQGGAMGIAEQIIESKAAQTDRTPWRQIVMLARAYLALRASAQPTPPIDDDDLRQWIGETVSRAVVLQRPVTELVDTLVAMWQAPAPAAMAEALAKPLSDEYLDQMQAHVDEGGTLSHLNAVELLAALRKNHAALRDHWVTGYGCDKEPRHADRTRFHCYCGWSSAPRATVGDALSEYIQHVLGFIPSAMAEAKGEESIFDQLVRRFIEQHGVAPEIVQEGHSWFLRIPKGVIVTRRASGAQGVEE